MGVIVNITNHIVHLCLPVTIRTWLINNVVCRYCIHRFYHIFGRPEIQAETFKARPRRIREDFFQKYCVGNGLDVGYGGDRLSENCTGWDAEHGDAHYLNSIQNCTYDFIYSSHTLEHMIQPEVALKNWWRVVKPGGYLILYVPHRDLYEKKKTLPSRWNPDHKHYFLPDMDEPPCTLGLIPLLGKSIADYTLIYTKICNNGHTITDPSMHSDGEYSIEIVIKKHEQENLFIKKN